MYFKYGRGHVGVVNIGVSCAYIVCLIPQIAGVKTNIGFLARLSEHASFVEGDVHTGFIEVVHCY